MNLPTLSRAPLGALLFLMCVTVSAVSGAEPPKGTPAKADPMDWPHWRGPEMNGISREKGLVSSWSPDGENVLWKRDELATRSTPIVMNGKLYALCRNKPETTQEQEMVVCVDAASGEPIWKNSFNVFLSDAPAERVGWSSVVGDPATGNVYALGLCGLFQCINGTTGETIWSHSLSEEYGLLSTYGGRTNFPVVFEDLVLISAVMTGWGDYAIPAHRYIAFDKNNGKAVWITSTKLRPEDTTYSSPILANFKGQAAVVFGAGDGAVYALQPRTGKVIWKHQASIRGINTTPLVNGNMVYCAHAEEWSSDPTASGAVFAIDGTGSGDVKAKWAIPKKMVGKSAPLLVDNRLYVIEDGAAMFILNPETGKDIVAKQKPVKLGTIMTGSMIYGDGKFYCGEGTGRWQIFEATDKGVKSIHSLRLGEEILGSPIISHGRIYLPTVERMYCIGDKNQKPAADPRPEPAQEIAADADTKPAQLQVYPVESLLESGQKQPLEVRLYNANGRFLKKSKAEFSVKGTGSVDAEGVYNAPKESGSSVAIVTATAEGLSGTARARVYPPLPWSYDFNDDKVPPAWIGVMARYVPRKVDGESMLVKVTTVPKGTRSQSWFGPTTLHDYTIQADLKGSIKNGKMPDMGLINQRYTLDLMGAKQQLQIRSWHPRLELRFAKTVPQTWKEGVWYTLKFQSENQQGKVVLRGKVWPRDEKEPAQWMIEAADETPNVMGSPGLFGNAQDAEISIDNLKVYANQKNLAQKP